jgi:hypothetical protein
MMNYTFGEVLVLIVLAATSAMPAEATGVAKCQLFVQGGKEHSKVLRARLHCSGAPVAATIASALLSFKDQFSGVTISHIGSTSGCLFTLSEHSHVIFTQVEALDIEDSGFDRSKVVCMSGKSTATFLRGSRPLLQQRPSRAAQIPVLPT